MRKTIAATAALIIGSAGAVRAQQPAGTSQQPSTGSQQGTVSTQPSQQQPSAPPTPEGSLRVQQGDQGAAAPAQPGATAEYTIQKGDTLWDLSQKFLDSPWYWPKIWSLNPGIENPHWIYPGNRIRVVPGPGGQGVIQIEQGQAAAGQPARPAEAEEEEPQEPADLAIVKGNSRESAQASRTVTSSGKLSFTPPPVLALRQDGLASPEEVRDSGVLDASFEEKELLANFDTGYVEFKNGMTAKPGDMLLLFRPGDQIVSPVTHRVLGQRVKTVGEAKVLSWNGKLATVQITRALEEIQRGDRARPWTPQMVRVSPRPNGRQLSGVIVSAVNPGLSELGESNQVYVDKGKADGVEVGNTFVVVRKGDGLSAGPLDSGHVSSAYMAGEAGMRASTIKTPDENVGLLIVVDVKDKLSVAMVVKSVRELKSGDVVEMRPQQGSGGP
jgi:nucleoid-associated protein YgaU